MRVLLAGLLCAAHAFAPPSSSARHTIYGVGTYIEGYGLQVDGMGLMLDPLVATIEHGEKLWKAHEAALAAMVADGSAQTADASEAANVEAAKKLIGNRLKVLKDLCNPMPRSQLHLPRLSMVDAPYIDQALREISRLLLGKPAGLPAERLDLSDQAQGDAWAHVCSFLDMRLRA